MTPMPRTRSHPTNHSNPYESGPAPPHGGSGPLNYPVPKDKSDVRDFDGLARFAAARAGRSLRRKDPVAVAYWMETERWAVGRVGRHLEEDWPKAASACARAAADRHRRGDFMMAALLYSRAKWFVILARNNGVRMDPRKTGVNLKWLEGR